MQWYTYNLLLVLIPLVYVILKRVKSCKIGCLELNNNVTPRTPKNQTPDIEMPIPVNISTTMNKAQPVAILT